MRLDGSWRRDPPAWSRRFREAAIVGAGRDHGIRDAGHFSCDRGVAFSSAVRILRIRTNVVFKLPAKTVLLHPDRDGARHPEGVPQSGVASLGQVGRPAKLPGLLGAEVEAAVFQKLSNTAKAT